MPNKAELRRELRARLQAIAGSADRARWSVAICRALAAHPVYLQARRVALFDAMPSEPDLAELWELAPRSFYYPRVDGSELRFFAVSSRAALPDAAAGRRFREPAHDGGPGADLPSIDLVLVPGLGFTRAGERLGRGGGYYDRLLARRPPGMVALGVCFELQIVADVPCEAHDLVEMDAVLTGGNFSRGPFFSSRAELI